MAIIEKMLPYSVILIILFSCSSASKLRRAEKLIKKAESMGGVWSSDTVFKEIPVFVTETRLDSIIVPLAGDTVVLEKERLSVKIVRLKGDTVFVDAACLPDTIKVKVPVNVYRTITAKGWLRWWHLVLAFVVGAILGRFVIRLLV